MVLMCHVRQLIQIYKSNGKKDQQLLGKNSRHSKWLNMDDTEPIKLEPYLHGLTPAQIFEKFFSPRVYQLIVDQTVRYAITQKNKNPALPCLLRRYKFLSDFCCSVAVTRYQAKEIIEARRRFKSGHRP